MKSVYYFWGTYSYSWQKYYTIIPRNHIDQQVYLYTRNFSSTVSNTFSPNYKYTISTSTWKGMYEHKFIPQLMACEWKIETNFLQFI